MQHARVTDTMEVKKEDPKSDYCVFKFLNNVEKQIKKFREHVKSKKNLPLASKYNEKVYDWNLNQKLLDNEDEILEIKRELVTREIEYLCISPRPLKRRQVRYSFVHSK